jgi:hypothetical protein
MRVAGIGHERRDATPLDSFRLRHCRRDRLALSMGIMAERRTSQRRHLWGDHPQALYLW